LESLILKQNKTLGEFQEKGWTFAFRLLHNLCNLTTTTAANHYLQIPGI